MNMFHLKSSCGALLRHSCTMGPGKAGILWSNSPEGWEPWMMPSSLWMWWCSWLLQWCSRPSWMGLKYFALSTQLKNTQWWSISERFLISWLLYSWEQFLAIIFSICSSSRWRLPWPLIFLWLFLSEIQPLCCLTWKDGKFWLGHVCTKICEWLWTYPSQVQSP